MNTCQKCDKTSRAVAGLVTALEHIANHPHLDIDAVPDDVIEVQLGIAHGHELCADIANEALRWWLVENTD